MEERRINKTAKDQISFITYLMSKFAVEYKMNRLKLFIIVIPFLIIMTSCFLHKEPTQTEVFIATVWKNGEVQRLTDGTFSAEATSVYISGDYVYVCGYEYNAQNIKVAKLWKNGIVQNLSDGINNATAYSVFVSNNDVYVVGVDGDKAKLWKNGESQNLLNGVCARSVCVSGNDVYVAGVVSTQQNFIFTTATLWKNGEIQNLANASTLFDSEALSVYVAGNDVYVTGWGGKEQRSNSIAKLWKNGEEYDLTDGSYIANAYCVFVSGSNVYVVGEKSGIMGPSTATLWINGEEQSLTDGSQFAYSRTGFVSENDVYIVVRDGYDIKLWKNGEIQYTFGGDNADFFWAGLHSNSIYVSSGDVYVVGYIRETREISK